MDQKLLDKICNDKIFLESLIKLENDEDIKKAFYEKGLEMSDDEVKLFKASVIKTINNENELSDSTLDSVAGGKSSWMSNNWQKLVYATSAVAVAGTAIWAIKSVSNKASGAIDEGRSLMGKANTTLDNVDGLSRNVNKFVENTTPVVNKIDKVATTANGLMNRVKTKGLWNIV